MLQMAEEIRSEFQSTSPVWGMTAKVYKKEGSVLYLCAKYFCVLGNRPGFLRSRSGRGLGFWGQRGCEGPGKSMDTSASHRGSEDHGVRGVVAWFDAIMADFFGIVVSKVIKPQAVLFLVHGRHQLCFQGPQLGCVQDALK